MSGFEEWRSTKHRFTSLDQAFESAWEAGFAAGVQAGRDEGMSTERERCARIAEEQHVDEYGNGQCADIAAAIRGQG